MLDDLQKQSVGLIGANGFIGSGILRAFLRCGIVPRAVCGPSEKPRSLPAGVKSITCDLVDVKRLESWLAGVNVVIHAAGPPSVRHSFEVPEEHVRVHVEGTTRLLHVCRMANVKRLVYISSAEVYGHPQTDRVAETHRLQACSPYAAAKIGAEKMIEAQVESFGVEAIILRPFSVYGPELRSDSVLSRIVSTANAGCVHVHDLRPVRDYCYIDDLAMAVVQACCIKTEKLRIINIGSGVGTSVAELAKLVLRTMDLNIAIREERAGSRPGRSEILQLIADITIARNVLGWRPSTDLEDGLRLALSVPS